MIASFSYSSANSSCIPVVHNLQFFFSLFVLISQATKHRDCVGLIHLTFFYITASKRFFQIPVYYYLGRRIYKLKPNSKEIRDNPNINKQARGLQRRFLLSTVRGQYKEYKRMQDTFSPLMVFSTLFLVQEHLLKENVTILCIDANFTRNFVLV